MIFQKLSQRDPRWANKKIGNTHLTIGEYGCFITCWCMALQWFGISMTPDQFAAHHEWFDSKGEMLPFLVNIPGVKIIQHLFGENDRAITNSIISPPQVCILKVNDGKHFILAAHVVKADFLCDDPWTGNICLAKRNYKNIVASYHLAKS